MYSTHYTSVRWLWRRRCRWRSDREMRYYNDAPDLYIRYIINIRTDNNVSILFPRPPKLATITPISERTATTTGASESNSNNNDNKNHIYIYRHTQHKYRPTTIIIITTSPSIGIYWALNTCS